MESEVIENKFRFETNPFQFFKLVKLYKLHNIEL